MKTIPLRRGAAAPAVLADPALEFGDRVEPKLSRIDAAEIRLYVALEVAQ
jgi:hypothetical protein